MGSKTDSTLEDRQTGNPAFRASAYTAVEVGGATMTIRGAVLKAFFFTLLLIGGAVAGWSLVTPDPTGNAAWPGWTWWLALAAFVVAVITISRPEIAPITGSLYSLLQGAVLGSISAIYDLVWDGIVLQAVIVTIGILLSVLVLYLLGVLRARPRLMKMVAIGTIGVALLYFFGLVLSLFGVDVIFWASPTSAGVFWGLVVAALAALNFVLDFDSIERYVAAGTPKQREWHAAFGVILTLVWLYLEVIRLIAISRTRQ